MTLHFINIGREKKSWTAEVDDLNDSTLQAQIREHKALRSQHITFVWNDDGTAGSIFVGIMRKVGEFRAEGGVKITID